MAKFVVGGQFLLDGLEHTIKQVEANELVVEIMKYKQMKSHSINTLELAWLNGDLVFEYPKELKIKQPISTEDLTEEQNKELELKLKVLDPVIHSTNRGFKLNVDEHLKQLEQEGISICKATFYNWKNAWDKYGDFRALINGKPGPKGRRTEAEVMNTLELIMNENLYGGEDIDYKFIYGLYKDELKKVNEMRDSDEQIIIRSFQTIWRIIKAKRDYYRQQKAREGIVAARLERDGSQPFIEPPTRPLQRVELDWTEVDIYVVDPKTLKRVKPYIIYAIDVCTGNPLGFYITLEHPDSHAIKQCLLHCFIPKTYISELYPDVENKWTAYGKPQELVVDNHASNNSYDIEDVCRKFGIRPLFPEVGAGHKKGTIERGLKTFNDNIRKFRGTTFSNYLERKQYDSEGKACITLQALYYIAHIIIVDVISHNWNHGRIGGTPHQKWEREFKEDPSLVRELPFSRRDITLTLCGGKESRKLQKEGIKLAETWYWSEELMKLRYRMKQEGDDDQKIIIRYDYSDARKIYVQNPYDQSYIEANIDPNALVDYEKHFGLAPELPLPFQQIKAIGYKIGKDRRDFDDSHVIRALKKAKSIEAQQLKDMGRGYKETLQEEAKIIESLGLQSYPYENLALPQEHETIRVLEDVDVKSKAKRKKGSTKNKKQNVAEVDVHVEGKGGGNNTIIIDISDDDLPDYETVRIGG